MIELQNISKTFPSNFSLKKINLRLEQGKTHVLLGSSGSGKSTLLRIIMGLTWPDSGQVKMNQILLTSQNQRQLVRKMGYVMQEGGLFPHLTAEKNVTLPARVTRRREGWSVSQIQSRVKELLSLVGLSSQVLQQFPKELSGGQRQRVALMRALMLDPQILLLDEPLGALDPIVRASLRIELKSVFNRLQKTVLIVTHDLDEAAFFGHTITLMHKGQIEQHGELSQLASKPASSFVTAFINAQKPSQWMKQIL